MKRILPSLRENNRYVLFQISKNIDTKKFKEKFENELISFLGQLEIAKSSFKLISFNGDKGVIKVNAPYLNKIKAFMALENNIDKEKVTIKSIKVSGILNKLK